MRVRGSTIVFRFRGKSGIAREIACTSKTIARILRSCQELPGQELFQYIDGEGKRRKISSTDINDYLRDATGVELTAKDFRTWAGTVLALGKLMGLDKPTSKAQAKRCVLNAVKEVARELGNTRSVCQRCYIHPAIIDSYTRGSLASFAAQKPRRTQSKLGMVESMVMRILRQSMESNRQAA